MNTESAPAASFERDDIELVRLFLTQYTDPEGNSYTLQSRPEETERKQKAIEAIAVAKNGKRLGIEHTSIHPFAGKKSDDSRLAFANSRHTTTVCHYLILRTRIVSSSSSTFMRHPPET